MWSTPWPTMTLAFPQLFLVHWLYAACIPLHRAGFYVVVLCIPYVLHWDWERAECLPHSLTPSLHRQHPIWFLWCDVVVFINKLEGYLARLLESEGSSSENKGLERSGRCLLRKSEMSWKKENARERFSMEIILFLLNAFWHENVMNDIGMEGAMKSLDMY